MIRLRAEQARCSHASVGESHILARRALGSRVCSLTRARIGGAGVRRPKKKKPAKRGLSPDCRTSAGYFSVFSRLLAAWAPSVPGYFDTTVSSVFLACAFWPD